MSQWDGLVQTYAQKYNVDPKLIASVIQVESSGHPNAYAPESSQALPSGGATGLGQQTPATAKALGIDPTDPAQSIEGVAKLLNENLNRYGNAQDAVLAYHGGTDQSNWGPKTQAYLQKVSTQYGGGQVAKPAAAPDADFEAAFGPRPAQVTQQGGADPFEAAFGPRPTASTASVATASPAQPAAVTPQPEDPGLLSKIGTGALNYAKDAINPQVIGAGAIEGVNRALDAPSEWISKLDGTYDQQVAANAARRAAYDQTNPSAAGRVAQLGGEIAGVAAPLGAVGTVAKVGGNALLKGLQGSSALSGLAPAAAAAGEFASGGGGILSRIFNSATQGGLSGAQLSGGQPDQSLAQAAGTGALLGGALPVVGGAIKGGYNTLRALVDPFTEGGQGRIAQSILERSAGKGPTTPDLTEYVPGSTPTLAQATGNPMLAAMERQTINKAPIEFGAVKDQANSARMAYLDTLRGTPQTLDDAIAAREQQAIPLLKDALADAKPANPQPVLDTIDSILQSPSGKQDAVTSAMNNVRSKIDLGSGGLETDPSQLYGVRKSINNQLEKVAGKDNSQAQQASRELIQVRNALDSSLEDAAPGFNNYLQQYAELSKPVNSQQYLQSLNMTDQTGQALTLAKVKGQMDTINRLRNAPGANDAKSLSDEQMEGLSNIQKDLLRESNSTMKGRSAGSNTAQNFAMGNIMQSALPGALGRLSLGPESLGGALGFALGGPMGAGYGATAGNFLRQGLRVQDPAIEGKLIDYLLDPTTRLARANGGAGNNLLNRLTGPAAGGLANRNQNNP